MRGDIFCVRGCYARFLLHIVSLALVRIQIFDHRGMILRSSFASESSTLSREVHLGVRIVQAPLGTIHREMRVSTTFPEDIL
jgi:hypothetical protein